MLKKIINLNIHENVIDFTADYIFKLNKRVVLINGGHRPFLFLRKSLAKLHKKVYFSPKFFTNNEFIDKVIFDNTEFVKISDLEASFMIYKIVKKNVPKLLNNNFSFATFMEWGFEIFTFIEQLDLENVSDVKLKSIKENAEIGYDVPKKINDLLKNLSKIRNIFHNNLEKLLKTTRGYGFLKVLSMLSNDILIKKFAGLEVILMSPFYLHKSEIIFFKKLYNAGILTIIIQGHPKKYKILEKLYFEFGESMPLYIDNNEKKSYELNVYSAYDDQSQGALLKNLISKYNDKDFDRTVIIVPDFKILQSIISEISTITENYNVSAGYPAEKTVIFSLFYSIIDAQLSKKGEYYYSKDLTKVLSNPIFKSMCFIDRNFDVSVIIFNKIEDMLYNKNAKNNLYARTFISFKEIIKNKQFIDEVSCAVNNISKHFNSKKLMDTLNKIFNFFFISWEKINNLSDLSDILNEFLKKICCLDVVKKKSLNVEAVEMLLSLSKEIKFGEISQENMNNEDILNVFKKLIKNKRIALSGSPFKGLQILGFLESRTLIFDNVFIIGMKDSSIPATQKDYSLVPKDIMCILGLEMVNNEYEIQKYHFDRLISSSKKLNLIYPDNNKDERSRFIESIIWDKQFVNKNINAIKTTKFVLPKFLLKNPKKRKYKKTEEVKQYLKNMFYTHTKIDVYLNCKLKFYFTYILSLNKINKNNEELSNTDMGNFIHDFLKNVFFDGLSIETIRSLEFKREYFKKLLIFFKNSKYFKFKEDAFMIKKILMYKMKNILNYEIKRSFKNIYVCEKQYVSSIRVKSDEMYNLNCRIDRIDNYGTAYMIFDYKTGYVSNNIVKKIYDLFITNNIDDMIKNNRQDIKKATNILQLSLYKYIFEKETKFVSSRYCIYDIKNAKIIEFQTEKKIYEKCINIIKMLLSEINDGEYFEFDECDIINCKSCEYFYICR
ncbi:MAG: PD-(D/E)XK nuclease family protein [Endomicrobium sp.]|jgi:CRISPR/Cas system-associated exonuclease Cas4 (RecB family)|nr:PD-(D/E)XK nuclease family protein [Endomicrobium sp.]